MDNRRAAEILSSFRGRISSLPEFVAEDFLAIGHAIGVLTSTGPLVVAPPNHAKRRLAMCIGTNYAGTSEQLRGCLADVERWSRWLSSHRYHVTQLTGLAANRRSILAALAELVRNADAEIVVQFSGHGVQVQDRGGDEQDRRDEAICPDDFRRVGVILDDELAEIFSLLPDSSRLLVVLDCCHSGTGTRSADGDGCRGIEWDATMPVPPNRRQVSAGSVKVTTLSACRDSEVAGDTQSGGAFTNAMLQSLINAADVNGTTEDWVTLAVRRLSGRQTPQHSGRAIPLKELVG